jgi:hypothetical protein
MTSNADRSDGRVFKALLPGSLLMFSLACATPFALESLEEGMASEAVRENVGEPEAVESDPKEMTACWSYVHESQEILGTRTKLVLLDFEEDRLVRWDVYEPVEFRVPLQPTQQPTLGEAEWTHGTGACPPFCSRPKLGSSSVVVPFPDPPTCESVRAQTGRPDGLKVGDTRYVGPKRVSLWSEPTNSRARTAYLDGGRRLKIIDKQRGLYLTWWCRVEDDGGGEGWLLCKYLTASEPR